jgi:acetyl esterase/lipase
MAWFPESLHFASLGLITISVQYCQLSVDGGSTTDAVANAIADAKSAIRWVRKYAATLGVNPNEVAAGGDSAGGQLALATATVPGFDDETGGPDATISATPDLLLVAYPVADTAFDERLSPYAFVNGTNLPPTLFLQGTADTLTPFVTAMNFCDRSNALAGRTVCHLVAVPGACHGFLGTPRFYRLALLAMDEFLLANGWLHGGPGFRADTIGSARLVKYVFYRLWSCENGYTADYFDPGGVW